MSLKKLLNVFGTCSRFVGDLGEVVHRSSAPARSPAVAFCCWCLSKPTNWVCSIAARLLRVRLCAGQPAKPTWRCRSADGRPSGPAMIGTSWTGQIICWNGLPPFCCIQARFAANRRAVACWARHGCGCSSGVEHNLAKVGVEGSNPFARSMISLSYEDRTFDVDRTVIKSVT